MALASFFLVTFDHERDEVRDAGWIYLVATHLGSAFLLAMFVLLGRAAGSLDFERWLESPGCSPQPRASSSCSPSSASGPRPAGSRCTSGCREAHPAAPSHVSAVMSGVMIKIGIYGLLRVLGLLTDSVAPWWGWLLVGIGAVVRDLGILFALAQRDLKRMLAYSSVENIGIIAIGLGLGLLGQATGQPVMRWLGFAGALAPRAEPRRLQGAAVPRRRGGPHATGTREIDRLGGLARQMPWTALRSRRRGRDRGLPPLNRASSASS